MNYDTRIKRAGKALTEKQIELLALLYYGFELVTKPDPSEPYLLALDMDVVDFVVEKEDMSALSGNNLLEQVLGRGSIKISSFGEQVFEEAPETMRQYIVEQSLKKQGFDLQFTV